MLSLYFLLFLSVHLISLYKERFENIFGIRHFYECYENEGNFQTYCRPHCSKAYSIIWFNKQFWPRKDGGLRNMDRNYGEIMNF